ncbi:MAG TPA: hypothetical protein PLV57_00730, partial [Phycisphaerae bacterium]|nr:hypothetical protein [Phycisphaerae bacterium]
WVGGVCIFILATIEVTLASWVFGVRNLRIEVSRGAAMRIPGFFWFIIKYVSPTYLLVIFGLWVYYNLPTRIQDIRSMSSEDRGTVLLILSFLTVLLIFFGLLINLAGKRWRAEGRLDGLTGRATPEPRPTVRERSVIP